MGPSLTIPIAQGRLGLGTWQGIYLNEHRCVTWDDGDGAVAAEAAVAACLPLPAALIERPVGTCCRWRMGGCCRNYGGARNILVTIQGQKRADGRKYSAFR